MSAAHFPIRCFSCSKPIAHLWDTYKTKVDDISEDLSQGEKLYQEKKILNDLGIGRMCCMRMFMTHVDLSHIQMLYPVYKDNIQRLGITTKSAKPKNFSLADQKAKKEKIVSKNKEPKKIKAVVDGEE